MCQNKCGAGSGWCHHGLKSWGLLGLRLAIGFIVAYLGYGKLGPGHAGAVAMMADIGGAGAGEFLAYLVGTLELVGGLMMIFGVFAPLAALWQSIILIVAMLTVHRGGPAFGYFLPLAVLGGCLALLGSGAGRYRLIKMQCCCRVCRAGGGSSGCGGNCGCGTGGPEMKDAGALNKSCACQKCCGHDCACGATAGACGCCKK